MTHLLDSAAGGGTRKGGGGVLHCAVLCCAVLEMQGAAKGCVLVHCKARRHRRHRRHAISRVRVVQEDGHRELELVS